MFVGMWYIVVFTLSVRLSVILCFLLYILPNILKNFMFCINAEIGEVLRARRNEKEMKVKPATSFKLLTIFIHKKNKTRFKTK